MNDVLPRMTIFCGHPGCCDWQGGCGPGVPPIQHNITQYARNFTPDTSRDRDKLANFEQLRGGGQQIFIRMLNEIRLLSLSPCLCHDVNQRSKLGSVLGCQSHTCSSCTRSCWLARYTWYTWSYLQIYTRVPHRLLASSNHLIYTKHSYFIHLYYSQHDFRMW